MAPKKKPHKASPPSRRHGVSKPPAHSVAKRPASREPSALPSAPVRKRPAAAARSRIATAVPPPQSACRHSGSFSRGRAAACAALDVIQGAADLPAGACNGLVEVAEQTEDPVDEAAFVREVGGALLAVERRLEEAVAAASARAQQDSSSALVAELKDAAVQRRQEAQEATKALFEARQTLQLAKAQLKQDEVELETLSAKMGNLRSAQEVALCSVKEGPAKGSSGQKHLRSLRKVGKEFGFHSVLLGVLPAVFKKPVDRRQTFDGLAVQQLEAEFAKGACSLEAGIQNFTARVEKRKASMEAAIAAVQEAESRRKATRHAADEAEETLADCEAAAAKARVSTRPRRVSEVKSRASARVMADAQARLDAFRAGPLEMYKELCASSRAAVATTATPVRAAAAAVASAAPIAAPTGPTATVESARQTALLARQQLAPQQQPQMLIQAELPEAAEALPATLSRPPGREFPCVEEHLKAFPDRRQSAMLRAFCQSRASVADWGSRADLAARQENRGEKRRQITPTPAPESPTKMPRVEAKQLLPAGDTMKLQGAAAQAVATAATAAVSTVSPPVVELATVSDFGAPPPREPTTA
eukprot:TRINITY_DN39377_c0_g1_i3.p1 TRINITY_DN39377_c0_g1~~TRINITY_DN39377_c0_g1_i3.p1  ORF type:complete len:601 (+),score=144.28 TRINITY_DN39377_c0_g1_i3:35-1804(+)